MKNILTTLILCFFCLTVSAEEDTVNQENVIATINKKAITVEEFLRVLQEGIRQTFYHGKIPESEFNKFRHKTLTKLLEDHLLVQYGSKMGLNPDYEYVNTRIEKVKERYKNHPQWEANKDSILSTLRNDLERSSIVKAVENKVKNDVMPTEEQVKKYYSDNPDKFTTPRQNNISVILLKVDPSSGTEGWRAGHEEAREIHEKLVNKTATFSELAKIHSVHDSAELGGEMGYVHAGTIADEVEKRLVEMNEGDVAEPIRVLEGFVIIKLNEVRIARLNALDGVLERAVKLCRRDMQEMAITKLKQKLKEEGEVHINMEAMGKISLVN